MRDAWENLDVARSDSRWKERVYANVDASSDSDRHARMLTTPSSTEYRLTRAWGPTPAKYAFSIGEVDRPGQHTPQAYLDDRKNLKGTRIKLLCRLGCLPVMDRVGREAIPRWPKEARTCPMCRQVVVEDVAHFVSECPSYTTHRTRMECQVARVLQAGTTTISAAGLSALGHRARTRVLLGQRIGDPVVEDQIDKHVKVFLTKAWNTRAHMASVINTVMGTTHEVWAAAAL
jgi:hypothetical protein